MPQLFDLTGHAAVVTGSTSGIGLAMADALAGAGADVMLNGLGDAETIERERAGLQDRHGVRVLYDGADMSRPEQVSGLIARAHEAFGRLDVLVNNAGVQHVSPVEDFPPEQWDRIVAINLSSAFHAIRAAVPIMKAQGRGRIVNLASAHSLVASPFKSAYVAAKHGLAGLTKAVALELATTGVTCNAVSPGFVNTPIVEGQIADQMKATGLSREEVMSDVILASQPSKRFVEMKGLTGLLLYLCSDAGGSATGANFSVDGGWTAR